MQRTGLSRRAVLLTALVGATLGVVFAWGPWHRPAPCDEPTGGVLACIPTTYEPAPLWAYVACAVGGALLLLAAVAAVRWIRRN